MSNKFPTETLLDLIQQALAHHPEGRAPRDILLAIAPHGHEGKEISRPTLNRLLLLGIERQMWSQQGAGRNIVYTLGADAAATATPPTTATEEASTMSDLQKNNTPTLSPIAVAIASRPVKKEKPKTADLHTRIRDMVWWIADTLRDKTSLDVGSYQPVTLALMALKRNMDIQTEQIRDGEALSQSFSNQLNAIQAGVLTAEEVAVSMNDANRFWSAAALKGDRAVLPLMTWADFANFQGGPIEDDAPGHRIVLRARPEDEHSGAPLFVYTTRATNLKALLLEVIDSLTPDLSEAFGAIGIHSVLGSHSNHAASLSNEILREICRGTGDGTNQLLYDFDLGRRAISSDIFSDTYMDLLGRFAEDSGKRGGEYFTPTALVENAISFLNIDAIAARLSNGSSRTFRIGDPTSGSSTFLIKTHEAITRSAERQGLAQIPAQRFAFFAQELKNTQAGLGVFNMFYHELAARLNPTEMEIELGRPLTQTGIVARVTGNTITEYVDRIGRQSGKLDLVVANPPYGADDYGVVHASAARSNATDKRWSAGVPNRSEGEWAFVQSVVDLLSPTGQAVVVLPLGVLFRDGGANFRQWLIEKDWIEGVIATPSNQFLTTSIPVCLLLINKAKAPRSQGGVFFVNATQDFTKNGKFNHWNSETALAAWGDRSEIAGYSGFVETDRLRKAAGYTLSVNRWFSPAKEQILRDPRMLAEQISRTRKQLEVQGRWLDDIFSQAEIAASSREDETGVETLDNLEPTEKDNEF